MEKSKVKIKKDIEKCSWFSSNIYDLSNKLWIPTDDKYKNGSKNIYKFYESKKINYESYMPKKEIKI